MKRSAAWLLLLLTAAAASGQTSSAENGARSGSGTVSPASALAPDACTPFAPVFCAHDERFWVSAIFSAPSLGISNAAATAVPLTNDTGYFWFFSSNNVELVVKVVDGRAFNGFYWVFCAALSDLAYTVTVTDTATGVVKTYTNPPGNLGSVADTAAFSGGTSTTCRYDVGAPIPATFSIVGGGGSVSVTTQPDCPWTAVSNSLFIYNVRPSSGTGSGVVEFSVAAMWSSLSRHGGLTVAGVTLEITQIGGLGP
jgi:hypothetical protein